jgi:methyl-accepting chemotaxis protein
MSPYGQKQGLTIGAALAWVCLLFALPLTVLTVLVAARAWGDIQAAAKEERGVAYLAQIWPAMGATDRDLGAGQPGFDLEFGTAEASDAFLRAYALDTRFKAGSQLIADVADGAGLKLDPELADDHLIEALSVRLPVLLNAATELSEAAQFHDADQAARVAVAVDHLQAGADQARAALEAAIKYDPTGVSHSVLYPHLTGLTAAARELAAKGQAVAGGGGDPNAVSAARADLQRQIDSAWRASQGELIRLLEARIQRLGERLAAELALVLALVILAAWTTMRIGAGLRRRLAELAEVGEKLASNQVYIDVPHVSAPGEVGRLALALDGLRSDLIERNLERYDNGDRFKATEAKLEAAHAALAVAQTERRAAIESLGAAIKRLGQGDLTAAVVGDIAPDFQGLKADFNAAIEIVREALVGAAGEAEAIQREVEDLARGADDLARRGQEQTAGLEAATGGLGGLTEAARAALVEARRAGGVVGAAKGEAEQGDLVVRQAAGAMEQIHQLAQQITQIVGVMDEIAFQTNILALNAGVEAARSGEAGRGFAIVAQEVRALAQRSATAAKEIRGLITASASQVGVGVDLVGRTSQALGRILGQVAEMDAVVAGLAAAAEAQAGGLAQVGAVVGRLDQSTQAGAAAIGQSVAAARALREGASELSSWMAGLRLAPPAPPKRPSLRVPPPVPTAAPSPPRSAPVVQLREVRGAPYTRRPFPDPRLGRRFDRDED